MMTSLPIVSARRRLARAVRGQAMIEFLISLIALVPLFFAIAMLGKYLDIKSATIQGARYAAWERTVWFGDSNSGRSNQKDDAKVQNEMRERIFSAPGTVMLQDDGAARTQQRALANAVWSDYKNAPMLPSYTDTTATLSNKAQGGVAGAINVLFAGVSAASSIGEIGSDNEFKLNQNGLYTARIQVNVTQPPKLLRGLSGTATTWVGNTTAPMTFGAGSGPTYGTNVLLADAWSASGPDWSNDKAGVTAQVSGLVPTSWPVVKLATAALLLKPFIDGISAAGVTMKPGKIDSTIIPPDRVP